MLDCIRRVPQILDTVIENNEGAFASIYDAYGERALKADEIIFIGSGTSNTASITARYFAEKVSGVRVSVVVPSEFLYSLSAHNPQALYVFISQTGTSILTGEALDYVKERGFMHAALSKAADTPLAGSSGVFINLHCGDEEYPMRTIGYSATVLVLMLLGMELGEGRGHISGEEKSRLLTAAKNAAANIGPIIDQTMTWLDSNRRAMLRCDGLFFYGSGALYGVALEGAVKVWETPQIISVGYELEEGIHGPNYGFNHRHCVIVLNDGGIENKKAVALAKYMKLEKNGGFIVGASPIRADDLAFEPQGGEFCCLEFAAVVQVVAYRLAEEQGRDLFAPHDNSVMESYFKSHSAPIV